MTIELEPTNEGEAERAASEARLAVHRAKLIVERSRALLLGRVSGPVAGPTGCQGFPDPEEETLIQVEIIETGAQRALNPDR